MKKLFMMILSVMLMLGAAAAEDFQTMAGLDKIQAKLDAGIRIEKVYYTDGYGFSISEFTTKDPEEISRLWTALNRITVKGRVEESITDWYPQIVFYLSDGTEAGVSFEANWLTDRTGNYEIENAEEFWALTASLVREQEEQERAVQAWREKAGDGWETPSDPAAAEEACALFEKAVEGLDGVNYAPAAYLGVQAAEHNHAILCRATTVYPGADPRWLIVNLHEEADGSVTVTDITEPGW